jgi:hypothetical protein
MYVTGGGIMKKLIVSLAFALLLAVSLVVAEKGGPYALTSCTDSDGDSPSTQGTVEWAYENPSGEVTGGGTKGDICSEIHYLNVMMYAGESFRWGEAVLVEGVCPAIGTVADQAGDIPIAKYYKCECENIGGSGEKGTEGSIGVCTGPAEEIPYEKVVEADKKWRESGRRELHPTLVRFLRFFGLWG